MAMMVSIDTEFTEIHLVLDKLIRDKRRFDAYFHIRASRRAAAKITLHRRSGLQSRSMHRGLLYTRLRPEGRTPL